MRLVVNDKNFIKLREVYTHQTINYSLKIDVFDSK